MKILGYELRKAPQGDLITSPQLREAKPQGPMTAAFASWEFRKITGDFYEMLREGIPIIDSAIRRLISLNGTVKIIGDNPAIVAALEDFCLNVPVNDMQKGIHAFLENLGNETFEQGYAVSEFIVTKDFKDIAGLRVADSKNIIFRRDDDGSVQTYYRPIMSQKPLGTPGQLMERIINAGSQAAPAGDPRTERKLNPANLLYHSINNENSNPYGVSIMRSLEFVSQILVTLQTSIKNVGERFGDPAFHVHYKGGKMGDQNTLEARRKAIADDFNAVIAAKRQGKSGDIVTAGSLDSDVQIKVIGHDGQILQYEVPLRHVLEQIVAKTNLPAWMLGIYWSTTERMATLEIEAALQDAKLRQLAMLPELIRLFSIYLTLRGFKWKSITTDPTKPGDWGIMFETPNLRDLVAQAQARFLNAQADMMGSVGAAGASQTQSQLTGARAEGSTIEINGMRFPLALKAQHSAQHGKDCGCVPQKKELRRTIDWPALDAVEVRFEAELKYDWNELKDRVLTIVGLKQTEDGKGAKAPDDRFSLTDAERQAIMKELETYLGYYDFSDTDSAVRQYYGQAYSLGLLQAAYLMGERQPLLNLIKNSEVYDTLCKRGFNLLKDSATAAIQDEIIAAMERHMLAGSNPLDVARDLERLFGDQNSDWERLARSEMSMAAETAKLDEWEERDVKMVEFAPAPDACPICMALAGDYPIASCPVAVRDTHPRCRCSTRPAASEA